MFYISYSAESESERINFALMTASLTFGILSICLMMQSPEMVFQQTYKFPELLSICWQLFLHLLLSVQLILSHLNWIRIR